MDPTASQYNNGLPTPPATPPPPPHIPQITEHGHVFHAGPHHAHTETIHQIGSLPFSGSDVVILAVIGLTLIAAGCVFLAALFWFDDDYDWLS